MTPPARTAHVTRARTASSLAPECRAAHTSAARVAGSTLRAGGRRVASDPAMNESVLLVEDDTSVAEATALLLERAGLRVVGAPDGRRALDLFGREPFDAVVLDVMLPV